MIILCAFLAFTLAPLEHVAGWTSTCPQSAISRASLPLRWTGQVFVSKQGTKSNDITTAEATEVTAARSLFVSRFSRQASEKALQDLFAPHAEVLSVTRHLTPKGVYAFVATMSEKAASSAMAALHGTAAPSVGAKRLVVNYAKLDVPEKSSKATRNKAGGSNKVSAVSPGVAEAKLPRRDRRRRQESKARAEKKKTLENAAFKTNVENSPAAPSKSKSTAETKTKNKAKKPNNKGDKGDFWDFLPVEGAAHSASGTAATVAKKTKDGSTQQYNMRGKPTNSGIKPSKRPAPPTRMASSRKLKEVLMQGVPDFILSRLH